MIFKIPFTLSSLDKLKIRSKPFSSFAKSRNKFFLFEILEKLDISITPEEYISICIRSFLISFLAFFVVSSTVLVFLNVKLFYLLALGIAFIFSAFIFFAQLTYPKVYISRKQKQIEKNLLPALQDMLIQLNSGIPLFSIMANISSSDYGELSLEFKKIVKRINSGEPETDVLDSIGEKNSSVFFRRMLWQISNGMRAGSNMNVVIKDSISTLSEEQLIQIQNYGNQLNPLVVFYMLISVIIPSLSITFLTILSSMLKIDTKMTTLLFIGIFVSIVLIQIMFIGVIKSKRPSLL